MYNFAKSKKKPDAPNQNLIGSSLNSSARSPISVDLYGTILYLFPLTSVVGL